MTDSTYDFHSGGGSDLTALEEDCKLLGSLLDGCLKVEVGDELFKKVEKIRSMAQCAATLAQKGDTEGVQLHALRMANELMGHIDEALPLTRACGHYLNLTSLAELHHGVRRARHGGMNAHTCNAVFQRLIAEGIDKETLYKSVVDQVVAEIGREVAALWQTDELRRQKPTPLDEAHGGLRIVGQSLWAAVPQYLRRLSAGLKQHTGHDLIPYC